jgi:transposase-like protein
VELLGEQGLLRQMTKAVLERALAEELTEHLGYEPGEPAGVGSGNSRNGYTPKTLTLADDPWLVGSVAERLTRMPRRPHYTSSATRP